MQHVKPINSHLFARLLNDKDVFMAAEDSVTSNSLSESSIIQILINAFK